MELERRLLGTGVGTGVLVVILCGRHIFIALKMNVFGTVIHCVRLQ